MKILLRDYGGMTYVWKEATRKDDGGFAINGYDIPETNVVSVTDVERTKYVKCSACEAVIPNRKKDIEAHKNFSCDWHNCLTCSSLREGDVKYRQKKYSLNEDGSFSKTEKVNVLLHCNASYYRYNEIKSPEARDDCKFARCRNATFAPIKTFFDENPDAFDDIITVDKIIDAGFVTRRNSNHTTSYKLKSKNNITAVVNEKNVVDYFKIGYRNEYRKVVYSKTLDKLFKIDKDYYMEFTPLWYMPESSLENIKKKIASLYK